MKKFRFRTLVLFGLLLSFLLFACQPISTPKAEPGTPDDDYPAWHSGDTPLHIVYGEVKDAHTIELLFNKDINPSINPADIKQAENFTIEYGVIHPANDIIINKNKITLKLNKSIQGDEITIEKGKRVVVGYSASFIPGSPEITCTSGHSLGSVPSFYIINNLGESPENIIDKKELCVLASKVNALVEGVKPSIDGTDILKSQKWALNAELEAIKKDLKENEIIYQWNPGNEGDKIALKAAVTKLKDTLTGYLNTFKAKPGTREESTSTDMVKLSWDIQAEFHHGKIENFKTETGDDYEKDSEVPKGTIIEFDLTANGYKSMSDTDAYCVTIKTESGTAKIFVDGKECTIDNTKGYTVNGRRNFGAAYSVTKTVRLTLEADTKLIVTGGIADKVNPTLSITENGVKAESKEVERSKVKDLTELKATASDNLDDPGDIKITVTITSKIDNVETIEPDWETAIKKEYKNNDTITVVFEAMDSAYNRVSERITYTVINDQATAKDVKCTFIGLDKITAKTGKVEAFIAKKEINKYGLVEYPKGTSYKSGTQLKEGDLIMLDITVHKTNSLEEEDKGNISLQFNKETNVNEYKNFTWKGFKKMSDYEVKGGAGQYSSNGTGKILIEITEDMEIAFTSVEPK